MSLDCNTSKFASTLVVHGAPLTLRHCGVLHVGGITMKGLQELLERVQRAELDGPVSRKLLNTANRVQLDKHRVEQDLTLKDGSVFKWEYLNPHTWMGALIERFEDLQDLFAVALRMHPVSRERPWRLVVAFDEFAPGNKLQCDNRIVHAMLLPQSDSHFSLALLRFDICKVCASNYRSINSSSTFNLLMWKAWLHLQAEMHGAIIFVFGIRTRSNQHWSWLVYLCCPSVNDYMQGPRGLVLLLASIP